MLQWMSQSRKPWHIDRAVRDLQDDALHVDGAPAVPLLSFERYDIKLEDDGLNVDRNLAAEIAELVRLQDMVDPRNMARLYVLAAAAAKHQVDAADFPALFRTNSMKAVPT